MVSLMFWDTFSSLHFATREWTSAKNILAECLFFPSISQLKATAVSGHAADGLSDSEKRPKGKYEPIQV